MISVTLIFPSIDAAVRVLREIPESALTSASAIAHQQPASTHFDCKQPAAAELRQDA